MAGLCDNIGLIAIATHINTIGGVFGIVWALIASIAGPDAADRTRIAIQMVAFVHRIQFPVKQREEIYEITAET